MLDKYESTFQFIAHLYSGNWEFRWKHVPFMDQNSDSKKGESILAHQWACLALWSLLRPLMPALSSIVDSLKVFELLAFHDIGEIVVGDTPLVSQLKDGSHQKQELEKNEIAARTRNLPLPVKNHVQTCFSDYTFAEKPSIEVQLSRYINSLQGNHFGLVFGNNLSEYSDLISQIVKTYFLPLSDSFAKSLKIIDSKAELELNELTDYHLQSIRSKGIVL